MVWQMSHCTNEPQTQESRCKKYEHGVLRYTRDTVTYSVVLGEMDDEVVNGLKGYQISPTELKILF